MKPNIIDKHDRYFQGVIYEDEEVILYRTRPQRITNIQKGIWPVYRLRKENNPKE